MFLTEEQQKRASKLHAETFIYDYYPLGFPIVIDEEIYAEVKKKCQRKTGWKHHR